MRISNLKKHFTAQWPELKQADGGRGWPEGFRGCEDRAGGEAGHSCRGHSGQYQVLCLEAVRPGLEERPDILVEDILASIRYYAWRL